MLDSLAHDLTIEQILAGYFGLQDILTRLRFASERLNLFDFCHLPKNEINRST